MNAKRAATPLLAALVVVEFTDVIFAVDSVPAVLAVSQEPFLVFAANAFAILGLRAAYFLLAGWKDRLHYLGHGLGLVLIFVGAKMAVSHWWHIPTAISLGVIVVLLTVAVVASRCASAGSGRRSSKRRRSFAFAATGGTLRPMSTEAALPRVLDAEPVEDLDAYVAMGGGRGLSKARAPVRPTTRSRPWSRPVCGDAAAPGSRRGGSGRPSPRTSRPSTPRRWS